MVAKLLTVALFTVGLASAASAQQLNPANNESGGNVPPSVTTDSTAPDTTTTGSVTNSPAAATNSNTACGMGDAGHPGVTAGRGAGISNGSNSDMSGESAQTRAADGSC